MMKKVMSTLNARVYLRRQAEMRHKHLDDFTNVKTFIILKKTFIKALGCSLQLY